MLRMILAEIAEARGDHLGALALLRCVTDRWPTSVPCWNMYSRSVPCRAQPLGTLLCVRTSQTPASAACWSMSRMPAPLCLHAFAALYQSLVGPHNCSLL